MAAAIASTGTTITTLILARYFPRILDHFEKKMKMVAKKPEEGDKT